jgi:predicted aspartyl protease
MKKTLMMFSVIVAVAILVMMLFSALLTSCTVSTVGKPMELTSEQIAGIDNVLVAELVKQKFDVIRSVSFSPKYLVLAKINNVAEMMIVDTGASSSFIKTEGSERLKLQRMVVPAKKWPAFTTFLNDKMTETYPVLAQTFNIGKTVLKPWPFVVSKESVADSILGCDFLHFTSAIFICNPGILLATVDKKPARNIDTILRSYGYQEIDLIMEKSRYIDIKQEDGNQYKSLDSGVFSVPVVVDGESGMCLVDTGAFFTAVDSTLIGKGFWVGKQYMGSYVSDAKGNRKGIRTIRLQQFSIGGVDIGKEVEVGYLAMSGDREIFPKTEENYVMLPKQDRRRLGIIGTDILRQQNAIIDFGNRKLYLKR